MWGLDLSQEPGQQVHVQLQLLLAGELAPVGCSQGFPGISQSVLYLHASDIHWHTFKRYSTARSGLKKAALMARSISALGNPILSIFAIASSRCEPNVRADGSLKVVLSAPAAAAAGTGEGVAGAFAVLLEAGAGAAGAAGVEAGAAAGVDGGFEVDVDAVGAALGYQSCQFTIARDWRSVLLLMSYRR